jgi:hypothetical protein
MIYKDDSQKCVYQIFSIQRFQIVNKVSVLNQLVDDDEYTIILYLDH